MSSCRQIVLCDSLIGIAMVLLILDPMTVYSPLGLHRLHDDQLVMSRSDESRVVVDEKGSIGWVRM